MTKYTIEKKQQQKIKKINKTDTKHIKVSQVPKVLKNIN